MHSPSLALFFLSFFFYFFLSLYIVSLHCGINVQTPCYVSLENKQTVFSIGLTSTFIHFLMQKSTHALRILTISNFPHNSLLKPIQIRFMPPLVHWNTSYQGLQWPLNGHIHWANPNSRHSWPISRIWNGWSLLIETFFSSIVSVLSLSTSLLPIALPFPGLYMVESPRAQDSYHLFFL